MKSTYIAGAVIYLVKKDFACNEAATQTTGVYIERERVYQNRLIHSPKDVIVQKHYKGENAYRLTSPEMESL